MADKGQGQGQGQVQGKLPPKPGPPKPVDKPKLSPAHEAKVKEGEIFMQEILGIKSAGVVDVLVSGVGEVSSDNPHFKIKRV